VLAPRIAVLIPDRERDVMYRARAHRSGGARRRVEDDTSMPVLASCQPPPVALRLQSEHPIKQLRMAGALGAVGAHAMKAANRQPLIDVFGRGDQRLVLPVVDHQLKL
jgi:hypothetical protein